MKYIVKFAESVIAVASSTTITDSLLPTENHPMVTSVRLFSISFHAVGIMTVKKCATSPHNPVPPSIPSALFAHYLPDLSMLLLNIFLLFMSRVTFPSQWEISIIVLHHKKVFASSTTLQLYPGL